MEEENLSKRERKRLNRQKAQAESKSQEKSGFIKKLVIIALVIAGAFLVWKLVTSGGESPEDVDTSSVNKEEYMGLMGDDHVIGNPESQVQVIEYGDFQCPACGQYHPILGSIIEEYGDRVAFVYRHLPLRQLHRHAQISAQASEAAAKQGKFWEMYDKLFESQDDWSNVRDPRSDFEKFASELELDVEQFKTDMNSDEVKKLVDDDYASALALGLNSTPSILVNGEKQERPPTYEGLKKILDSLLSPEE